MDAGIHRDQVSESPTRRSFATTWNRYWFSDVDPHAYAIIRIALGVVGLMGLVGLTPVSEYWSPEGLAPALGGGTGIRELLISHGLGNVAGYALYALLWVSFICMVAGLWSSAAVAVCFVGSAVQGFWNPLPLSSSHKVLVALLFCLMWADSGRVLSLDAWRRREGGRHSQVMIWPLRLLRIQIGLIYFSSGLMKLLSESWRDGTAVRYTLETNAFHRFPTSALTQWDWPLTALTYVTVVWELAFVLLVLNRRTRVPTLWFGVLMHVGMAITLELGTFSAVMLTAYLAFVDPASVTKLIASLPSERFADAPASR